jgi:hypothetical protein
MSKENRQQVLLGHPPPHPCSRRELTGGVDGEDGGGRPSPAAKFAEKAEGLKLDTKTEVSNAVKV